MDLANLNIIVTGSASGMGAYFARQLVAAGAQVAAGDVETAGMKVLTEETEKLPGTLHTRALDVTLAVSTADFVDWAAQTMGGLNGLINNAGIIRDGLLVKKDRESGEVLKLSREDWQQVIDVNLTGATWMVRETVAAMLESQVPAGVIVNMSSISRGGNRGQSNYVAAKAALAANTVTWAREFARYGIRVGALAPGIVETPMTGGMQQKSKDSLIESVPLGRIGTPHDVWLGVKFIIENDYFTGRCIDIDGGLNMT